MAAFRPANCSVRPSKLVDGKTGSTPAYYMVNCAHPTHFDCTLVKADWTKRIRGIRANASRCSHAELDKATELDAGNPSGIWPAIPGHS